MAIENNEHTQPKTDKKWSVKKLSGPDYNVQVVSFDRSGLLTQKALHKSIAGRYRSIMVADGPITARYRFIKNASWAGDS